MKGKNITISLNNDNPKNILIDESRLIYTNKELYDITIIEIKKNDGFELKSFFEFDEEIYRDNLKINNKQNQVYIINNFDSQKVDYYITEINNINFDFDTIEYISKKGVGLSGTPIFNYNNYKVIGIKKWIQEENDINLGTLIKEPIINFYNKYKKKNNNNNFTIIKNINY
jgi:hypothetical protein